MRILFCSNYFTHHQIPLSDALYELTNHNYCFVAHKEMDAERKNLGWGNDLARPYTCSASDQEVQKQLNDLDVLIAGSFPERQTKEYGKKAKLFFRYSERILKTGNSLLKYPKRFFHWHACNPPWQKAYMLCASAYTAGDYAKFGLFHDRCYKWGYFPETIRYSSIDDLIDRKAKATILWCGRFLNWKHPDDVIEVAKRLHEAGCCFTIEMIGTGEMEQQLKRQASEAGLLGENVRFLGAMSPEAVRCHMESASICLFTSDRQEGWGAVLNEAMNSGCAVVASDAAGATPYLVNDGVNGSVYHSGNIQELCEKVRRLLENTTMQYSFGKAAYQTITELWNAEVAAKRFLQLSQALLNGADASGLFANGPCSLQSRCGRTGIENEVKDYQKRIVIHLVNHTLAGTRFFSEKRNLLRSIGYEIGENTKIVGPIHNTGTLRIGANCWIGCNLTVHGNGTVTIGDNCDIAPDVTFLTGGHQMGNHSRRAGKGESYHIAVGRGVWIGGRSTLLLNTSIGDGSMIAACACVSKDVPADTMVAGVPAEVVKEFEDFAAVAQKE